MLLHYNEEKLKSVIMDFYNLTGISISIMDTEFNHIVRYPDPLNAFCTYVQTSKEGKRRCALCDCEVINRCIELRCPISHRCHAGLTDTAVPIISNGVILGFIMFGQVFGAEEKSVPFPEIYKNVKDLDLDAEILRDTYESIMFFDAKKIESASKIVSMLTKYIWQEQMISPEYNADFEMLLKYIDTNVSQPMTVSFLCHKFNISKNALYANFKKYFGCAINEYINRQRILRAEQLLKTTCLPIYDICERVGIGNYNYFCRLFKKEKGTTPLQFRKQWLNGKANTGS